MKLVDAFRLTREGEVDTYNPLDLGNKKLLWHGSRFSNFVGILSQGMRIAPPEAPRTGYNFGKGVYFADLSGKSANYTCYYLSNNVGLFLLCDVALGEQRRCTDFDSNADYNLGKYNSTLGVGYQGPDPS